MNDREEYAPARTFAARLLEERTARAPEQSHELHREVVRRLTVEQKIVRVFSFSLSEKPDVLSQWRGYAPNGGFSVGFSTEYLAQICGENKFKLGKCYYDENAQAVFLHDIFDSCFNGVTSWPRGQELLHDACEIEQKISQVAAFIKHSSFEEEAEWRMLGTVDIGDERSRWRVRASMPHPYAELKLSPAYEAPGILNEIFVGPGFDRDLVRQALDCLNLEARTNCRVKFSASTLR